ncbi:MAG TPA: FAD-dependent monooxygenase [Mycobacteriales bacterium]|nr:FAD-dependent monooxygenase [Mycobacteriales bacterium]
MTAAGTMATGESPVIVIGGGPTGLTAALELAYHGVASIVLDAGQQRVDGSRAIALHSTALAVWERLGCVEPMMARGVAWRARRTFYRERELYAQLMPAPAPGELPTFLNLQQYSTENCLIRRARSVGTIDLRWEHRVVGVAQDESGVVVEAETPGGPVRLRGHYVLACDGARSSMRKLLGLDFPGTTYQDRFLIADIRAELPLPPEPRFFFDHPTNPGSTVLLHPQPGGVWRIDWQLGSAVDIAAERAPQALARRIQGIIGDVPYELVWLSDYRFHQRLLDRLRHGRIFFLGDAAHLVAPFGARGLNSAIHDVENLGWKLAWVLRGAAPESLLDTYQVERWPALRHDQAVTNATMRFMAPRTMPQRLWRNAVLRLGTVSRAARRWVNSGKMSRPFTYRASPVLVPDDAPRRLWRGAPALGGKAPDAACLVVDAPGTSPRPTRLRWLLGAGFVALYFADDDAGRLFAAKMAAHLPDLTLWPVLPDAPRGRFDVPAIWDDTGQLSRAFGAEPGTLFLIRPDGHLAARRHQARAEDVAHLLRLASGNPPVETLGDRRDQVLPGRHST